MSSLWGIVLYIDHTRFNHQKDATHMSAVPFASQGFQALSRRRDAAYPHVQCSVVLVFVYKKSTVAMAAVSGARGFSVRLCSAGSKA